MKNNLYRRILYYITVPKCVFCSEILDFEDKCFCKSCAIEYNEWKDRSCSRCFKPLTSCLCSTELLVRNRIKRIVKVYRYRPSDIDSPSKRIIFALKESNRSDVFEFLSQELTESIKTNIDFEAGSYIITNVPRRRKAIMKFGYDHAAVLAKHIARRLGIEYAPLLKSLSKREQKKSTPEERKTNLKIEIRKGKSRDLSGYTVILIDDIITSGNSMLASIKNLRLLKCKTVIPATIGIVYKDMPID